MRTRFNHAMRPAFTAHLVRSGMEFALVAAINSQLDGKVVGPRYAMAASSADDLWLDFLATNVNFDDSIRFLREGA